MKKTILLLLGLFIAGIAVAAVPIDLKKDKIETVISIDQVVPAVDVITINTVAYAREIDSGPTKETVMDEQNFEAIPVDNQIRARSHWRTAPSLNYLRPNIDVDYPYSPRLSKPPVNRPSLK